MRKAIPEPGESVLQQQVPTEHRVIVAPLHEGTCGELAVRTHPTWDGGALQHLVALSAPDLICGFYAEGVHRLAVQIDQLVGFDVGGIYIFI